MSFRFFRSELDLHVGRMCEETRRAILRESAAFEASGYLAEDAALRREADDFARLMPMRASSSNFLLPMVINSVHRFYSMRHMEKVFSDAEPWTPGQQVTADTHVRGRDFRTFYQEGWDKDWYHEDSEFACEDEFGSWILPDDDIYPIGKLGHLAWQGPDRGSDWTGQARVSGEMIPIWTGFARWAAEQVPAPACEAGSDTPDP